MAGITDPITFNILDICFHVLANLNILNLNKCRKMLFCLNKYEFLKFINYKSKCTKDSKAIYIWDDKVYSAQ